MAFDRLALLADWQAFHQPPWASLSTTGGRGGGAELIAVIFQSSRYVLFNQARYTKQTVKINKDKASSVRVERIYLFI